MELYHQKVSQFNELHDNALDEYAFETNERLNRELKEHHSSIMDSYDKLQQKVSQMSQKVFNNEKVETLWRLVSIFVTLLSKWTFGFGHMKNLLDPFTVPALGKWLLLSYNDGPTAGAY